MSDEWRVFAAIDITDEIRDRIKRTQQMLEDAGWRCRWVQEDRMHMTVRFYGNLAIPTVERLQDELRPRLAAQPRFELRVSRVGAFPGPNRPRTIWLGIDDRFEQLGNLRAAVDAGSDAAGIEPETGPYRPHLTVGRLRHDFRVDSDDAVEAFQKFGAYEPLFWVPDTVKLVRSQFTRGGVQYTTIEEFELGPPDGTVSEGSQEDVERIQLPTLLDYLDDTDPPDDLARVAAVSSHHGPGYPDQPDDRSAATGDTSESPEAESEGDKSG